MNTARDRLAIALRAAEWESRHMGPFNHSGREIRMCTTCRARRAKVADQCPVCHYEAEAYQDASVARIKELEERIKFLRKLDAILTQAGV